MEQQADYGALLALAKRAGADTSLWRTDDHETVLAVESPAEQENEIVFCSGGQKYADYVVAAQPVVVARLIEALAQANAMLDLLEIDFWQALGPYAALRLLEIDERSTASTLREALREVIVLRQYEQEEG